MFRLTKFLRVLVVAIILHCLLDEVESDPRATAHSHIFDMEDILAVNKIKFDELLTRLKAIVDYRNERGCSVAGGLEDDMVSLLSKTFSAVSNNLLTMQGFLQDLTGHFKGNPCAGRVPLTCPSDHWRCHSGHCILENRYCDGEIDCRDGSDEPSECKIESDKEPSSANSSTCQDNQFACKSSGKCIAGWWKCDGVNDCSDGSDEQNCYKLECNIQQFRCVSLGVCIDKSRRCDGYSDCFDGSDEAGCQVQGEIDSDKVQCVDSIGCIAKNKLICLPLNLRCNGIKDCDDGYDEINCARPPDQKLKKLLQLKEADGLLAEKKLDTHFPTQEASSHKLKDVRKFPVPNFVNLDKTVTQSSLQNRSSNIVLPSVGTSLDKDRNADQAKHKPGWPFESVENKTVVVISQPETTEDDSSLIPWVKNKTGHALGSSGLESNFSNVNLTLIDYVGQDGNLTSLVESQFQEDGGENISSNIYLSGFQHSLISLFKSLPEGYNSSSDVFRKTRLNMTVVWTHKGCNSTQFACKAERQCIPRILRCDGVEHCQDGADEIGCQLNSCGKGYFSCKEIGGTVCISEDHRCDGKVDCEDIADELNCNVTESYPPKIFLRLNGQEYSPEYLVPEIEPSPKSSSTTDATFHVERTPYPDQADITTEVYDYYVKTTYSRDNPVTILPLSFLRTSESSEQLLCDNNSFRCKTYGLCIRKSLLCNGNIDCPDESDEWNCKVTCKDDELHCKADFKCVSKSWECDGEADCSDGQDERNCTKELECNQPGRFRCTSGNCIHYSFVCDGEGDCPDESDEVNCLSNAPPSITTRFPAINQYFNYTTSAFNGTCSTEQFLCDLNAGCIPLKWQCDGETDCPNGEDESGCPDISLPTIGHSDTNVTNLSPLQSGCTNGWFRCRSSGICIDRSWVCDGDNDCDDNTDESYCPLPTFSPSFTTPVTTKTAFSLVYKTLEVPGTQQAPIFSSSEHPSLVGGSSTEEPQDHFSDTLTSKPIFCEDDLRHFKCKTEEKCVSFSSLCNGIQDCSDYSDEGQKCELQRNGFILVSLGRRLEAFSLDVQSSHRVHTEQHGFIIGISYDPVRLEVYWSVLSLIRGGIYRTGIADSDEPQLFLASTTKLTGLAVDWLGRNIYIADEINHIIKVCTLVTADCTTLIQKVAAPRALRLDLSDRKIYWTDTLTPLIEVADMNGEGRTQLVSSQLGWPNGLALDMTHRRIYWMDGRYDTVEYLTMEGHHRQIIANISSSYPYSVEVWKDKIYWTDLLRKQALTCTRENCTDIRMFASPAPVTPSGTALYHPSLFKEASNPCNGHSCSHICLLSRTSSIGYDCACPDQMTLALDKQTCV